MVDSSLFESFLFAVSANYQFISVSCNAKNKS